jgi:RNA polymerase sigma-70 factor (ECF subfamily)
MTTPDQDLTAMIVEARSGDGRAADVLLEAIYGRLRAMAEEKLKGERPGHTLQATALVHEAYLKLVDQSRAELNCRSHFCAVAAQAMRRILVDHARGKQRAKRGGAYHGVTLDDAHALSARREIDLLELNDAIEKIRRVDARQAGLVEIRLFGGLTMDEAARMLDMPKRTAEREWKMAVATLRRELRRADEDDR